MSFTIESRRRDQVLTFTRRINGTVYKFEKWFPANDLYGPVIWVSRRDMDQSTYRFEWFPIHRFEYSPDGKLL